MTCERCGREADVLTPSPDGTRHLCEACVVMLYREQRARPRKTIRRMLLVAALCALAGVVIVLCLLVRTPPDEGAPPRAPIAVLTPATPPGEKYGEPRVAPPAAAATPAPAAQRAPPPLPTMRVRPRLLPHGSPPSLPQYPPPPALARTAGRAPAATSTRRRRRRGSRAVHIMPRFCSRCPPTCRISA